jgi:chromosome segregation ATPase
MNKNTIYLLLILPGILLLASQVSASSIQTPSSYLVEFGRQEMDQGRVEDAIRDFRKALILDPDHPGAKAELRKLGLPDYIGGAKTADAELIHAQGNINKYQAQIAQLQQDKKDMEERVAQMQQKTDSLSNQYMAKNLELEVLLNKVSGLKTASKETNDKFAKQMNDITQFYIEQNRDLNETVIKQKEDLVNQHIALNRMEQKSGKINNKMIEKKIAALGSQYNRLEKDAEVKMELQRKMIDLFSDYLQIREARLIQSDSKLVSNEIDKVGKERRLLKKMDEVIALQDKLGQYNGRIEDRDKLIVDKNKELEFLRQELYNRSPADQGSTEN